VRTLSEEQAATRLRSGIDAASAAASTSTPGRGPSRSCSRRRA
jgi:hypothetical protein